MQRPGVNHRSPRSESHGIDRRSYGCYAFLSGDDDCDTEVDEDAGQWPVWSADGDGDGFGDAANRVRACIAPDGWLSDATDCDDARVDVHPGAAEVCDAADVDEDCDGLADADHPDVTGLLTQYADKDGDGWGAGGQQLRRPTLTLDAGADVDFLAGAGLEVARHVPGSLVVAGTEDAPVTLTAADPTAPWAGLQSWGATRFEVDHADIGYGGYGGNGAIGSTITTARRSR